MYIEHDAENLQFYLWCRDYTERFEKLPASEKALSPEWSSIQTDADVNAVYSAHKKLDPSIAAAFQGTDFHKSPRTGAKEHDPFADDWTSMRSSTEKRDMSESDTIRTDAPSAVSEATIAAKADEAFGDSGLKWAPFTTQPFRQEINRIVNVYFATGGARQLNLSDRERSAVMHGLQNTTHPSALRIALTSVEWSLRRQAHPNFIRWAICNGNRPRTIFARGLGVFVIVAGIIADLLITLSSASRGWRVLPFLGYLIGISTLFAGYKGMCVVLHGMHHRHIRPWELFADEDDTSIETQDMSNKSNESIASNSYEDQPWVAKYQKRNFIRKIFDREVWIQEPALRQIQDTIFIQSLLIAAIIGGILIGIFCAVPAGRLY
ncbi:hypothetical protein K461DRAFT_281915 [Myriangium duriaei CBS 260.36]|uniref:RGS domain-containing protein n=1 Tax=Myriangium duriaei CBS 260.36 TaxID=1168546 RepID=A0A9P4ME34_9PEZI|nr:hypothetical protein K461DRAFT_281915 [Myriangium duriaei CBS 260.36]